MFIIIAIIPQNIKKTIKKNLHFKDMIFYLKLN